MGNLGASVPRCVVMARFGLNRWAYDRAVSTADEPVRQAPEQSARPEQGGAEFEALITDISARFVSLDVGLVDHAIENALQRLGEFLGVMRGSVTQLDDGGRLVFTHYWSSTNEPPPSFSLDSEKVMPVGLGKLLRGETHQFSSLDELPVDSPDREFLSGRGTLAAVALPLIVDGTVIGTVGFSSAVERPWDDTVVSRLRAVADVVANALARTRLDATLRHATADRLQFETLIADLAAQFVNLESDRVDTAIEEAQRRLVEALDLDRSTLFEFDSEDRPVMTHYWSRPGFPVIAIQRGSPVAMFPWMAARLRSGETVCLSSFRDLPENVLDRESMQAVGTKSNVTVPLVVADRVIGALAFGAMGEERTWPDDTLRRLRLIGQVFANALARKRVEVELRRSLDENARLRERLIEENVQLRSEVNARRGPADIIGQSAAIHALLAQVEQVAPTDATVLLLGETGTGKELIARAIHERSRRSPRPMVSVNCAAIPTALIESELFGREKGAYTGALARQIGRFELAEASTIFLDEIGELPVETQVKLLRVLQEREVERLGGTGPIRINVRVIAATNRDLEQMIADDRFREDLYYRLNVFAIRVPPLRERPDDIPTLVWAFVDEFARALGRRVESIQKEQMLALQRHRWPGNVRELRNVVERAMIVSDGPRLLIEPPRARGGGGKQTMKIEDVEREHIRSVLESTGWRIRGEAGAAAILGLKPSTLESRMAKHGLRRTRA
jgi:formate hydrogenlyase transcriptional activator